MVRRVPTSSQSYDLARSYSARMAPVRFGSCRILIWYEHVTIRHGLKLTFLHHLPLLCIFTRIAVCAMRSAPMGARKSISIPSLVARSCRPSRRRKLAYACRPRNGHHAHRVPRRRGDL